MKTKAEVMKDLAKVRRRKIIVQKKSETVDEYDNPIEVWQDWKTLKAEKSNLWGREYYEAATVNEENTVVFTVRYVPFIDEMNTIEYRIIYNNKSYNIKNIDHVNDDIWVKIKALEDGDG